MIAHNYHPESGRYIGSIEAEESPLEKGVFLLPAFATFKTPPDSVEGKECFWNGNKWELRTIPSPEPEPEPKPITWDQVREIRNGKLSSSDWTQLPDIPFAIEELEAWRTYRQQLRDIPMGEGNPEDVIWPTAP
jgi:hypothetical protein